MMSTRIYLAGPEVFLSNAREIGARKRAICEQHGLLGVFPTDEEDACDPALSRPDQGLAISRAMERVMRTCNAMIANLTPFRGPSADVGKSDDQRQPIAKSWQSSSKGSGKPLASWWQTSGKLLGKLAAASRGWPQARRSHHPW